MVPVQVLIQNCDLQLYHPVDPLELTTMSPMLTLPNASQIQAQEKKSLYWWGEGQLGPISVAGSRPGGRHL